MRLGRPGTGVERLQPNRQGSTSQTWGMGEANRVAPGEMPTAGGVDGGSLFRSPCSRGRVTVVASQ
jgi:hypothetical protein